MQRRLDYVRKVHECKGLYKPEFYTFEQKEEVFELLSALVARSDWREATWYTKQLQRESETDANRMVTTIYTDIGNAVEINPFVISAVAVAQQ